MYLEACIYIADKEALIVADNVLAGGSVADSSVKTRKYTELMKEFNKVAANHPKLESVIFPIGDGMTLARVKN
jgi:predicted O-methyltransferase YrrM